MGTPSLTTISEALQPGDFCYLLSDYAEFQGTTHRAELVTFWEQLQGRGVECKLLFTFQVESMARRTLGDSLGDGLRIRNFSLPVSALITPHAVYGLSTGGKLIELGASEASWYYQRFFLTLWNKDSAVELVDQALSRLGVTNTKSFALPDLQQHFPQACKVLRELEAADDGWVYTGNPKTGKIEQLKFWSVPKTTAEFLTAFTLAADSKEILEIGTSAGYSTLHLAMAAKCRGGRVRTIEKLPRKQVIAEKVIVSSGLENISLLSGDALELIPGLEGDFDLIFLDADREKYAEYALLLLDHLKVGGYLITDNVTDYGNQMGEYLSMMLGNGTPGSQTVPGVRSALLPLDNGVLISRKVG